MGLGRGGWGAMGLGRGGAMWRGVMGYGFCLVVVVCV